MRALFLSLAVLLSLPMMAVEVEIDGINYDLVAETKQATVIAKSSGKYSGEVVIPESVEHEGTAHSVTSIGEDAFFGCSGLTSVAIPNSVTSIGSDAFYYCEGLTSVHISDIAAWCNIDFDGAYSHPLYHSHHLYLNGEEVKDLIIPNSVTSIGKGAFSGCEGLTSVTIPNGVTSIGETSFQYCYRLTSVTIPNSVTSIGGWAFNDCFDLTSVTIGNSVTSIGSFAFSRCSGLTSVTIPNSVTSIGRGAFYSCSGLTSVTIPNSVTYIDMEAFYGCSGLTSVTIGNSVESIGSYAFSHCSKLIDVYCYAEKVPSTGSDAFERSYSEYLTLHVPDASIDSYKATEPWSSFGSIIGLSGEQPEVEKCASPVVTYADGKLSFSCETEGTEFVTNITDSDIKKHYDAEIELSATYNIEVFATKANYDNSDTVSVALVWVENGDTDVETGIISVEAAPVLIHGNGGVLSVSGLAKGTEVVVYTISGTEVARATATEGTATISTGLQSGTIVVVNFGNKSVKVRI